MKNKPIYTWEIDDHGCNECGHERTWMIIDPYGIMSSTSWGDEEVVIELVNRLNEALATGRKGD